MIFSWIGIIAFGVILVMTILLALGFPLGEFSMGGKHKVFPREYRIAAGVSVIIQAFAIAVLLQLGGIYHVGFWDTVARGSGWILFVYLCINTVMNLFSYSKKEKYVITPLSAVVALCFLITLISA